MLEYAWHETGRKKWVNTSLKENSKRRGKREREDENVLPRDMLGIEDCEGVPSLLLSHLPHPHPCQDSQNREERKEEE